MSTTLSYQEPEKTYKIIELGNHIARCVQVVDLGTQKGIDYTTKQPTLKHKLRVIWELPYELIEWEDKDTKEKKSRPQLISQDFTASLHEKAQLRLWLKTWRGRDFTPEELQAFELAKLLKAPCNVNVIHEQVGDKTYANISAVTPLTKGTVCPDQITPSIHFDLDNFDQNIFDSLPKFIQDKIDKSEERNIKDEFVNSDGSTFNPDQTVDTPELPDPAQVVNELPEVNMDEIQTPF